jgi:hypothetical protein
MAKVSLQKQRRSSSASTLRLYDRRLLAGNRPTRRSTTYDSPPGNRSNSVSTAFGRWLLTSRTSPLARCEFAKTYTSQAHLTADHPAPRAKDNVPRATTRQQRPGRPKFVAPDTAVAVPG